MACGPGKSGEFDEIDREFREREIPFLRERFRVPSYPEISPSAGFALCAAGGFLLAAGMPAASFLFAVTGILVLLLGASGFSPLDWLGPKEWRTVLILPGDPSEGERKALFFALPLSCALTGAGGCRRKESLRRASRWLGILLSLAVSFFAGAVTLLYFPPLPAAGLFAGATLILLSVAASIRISPPDGAHNLALDWAVRGDLSATLPFRPFLLFYSGDLAEVKFFLAKYRRHVFRGSGVFLEFPETAEGPAAVTVAEGPYFAFRVDRGLLSAALRAATACGIHSVRPRIVRKSTPALAAMARGFRAITLSRLERPSGGEARIAPEAFVSWIRKIGGVATVGESFR